jgi:hypothetical protein
MLQPTVSRPVCPGVKPLLGPKTRYLLLSDSFGFVDMGRPFSRQDRSVVYNYCWSSPAKSFSGPYFTASDSRLPQPEEPGLRIYIPQEQSGPVIPTSARFPVRHLRLSGLQWISLIYFYNISPIVARVFVAGGKCLLPRCLPTAFSSVSTIPDFRR